MTLIHRVDGEPSPFSLATHDDADLRPAIPFDVATASPRPVLDMLDAEIRAAGAEASPGLSRVTGLIRPICVGALMAIPTVGTATVGLVAMFSERRAMAMVRASTAFLAGIPSEIVLLIGALATGYGVAKSIERIKGTAA